MEKQFVVDMDVSVCFEANAPCDFTTTVMKNARLPKPICDLSSNLSFEDISLKELSENLLLDVTQQLPSYAADILLERLGISQWMQDVPCSRQSSQYTPNVKGWKIVCPSNVPIQDLTGSLSCTIPDYCTGIDCCVEIPQIGRTFHVYLLLDACLHRLKIGIENLGLDQAYFNFEFDKINEVKLSQLISLRYSVSDLEEKKKYIVNMEITVCLEPSGACIFTWNILKDVYLPKLGCDWNEDFSDFSPSKVLHDNGQKVLDDVSDLILSQVLEKMGVTDYLLAPQCDVGDYTPNVNGWVNNCPAGIINMTLPNLPTKITCKIDETCTIVDCCISVDFLKRNIHLEVVVDICSRQLSFSVEKLTQDMFIFDYAFDIGGKLRLLDFVSVDYTIDNTKDMNEFRVNLNVTIQLDDQTILYQSVIMKDTPLLRTHCDWNTGFSVKDFSLQSYINQFSLPSKDQLTELMADKLIEELGIGGLLQDTPCQRSSSVYSPSLNGWKNECPLSVNFQDLTIQASCFMPSHCTAVDCCIDVDFLHRSFHTYIDLNTCDNTFKLGIEKLKLDPISLTDYQFGTTEQFNLKGIIRISYKIEDLNIQRKIRVDLNMSICFESNEPCLYEIVLFKDALVPKILCDWEADFSIPDFSLDKYVTDAGELMNSLTEPFIQKLMEDLGISSYQSDKSCNITSDDYTPNYQGWKSECDQALSLPPPPNTAVCVLEDTCTECDQALSLPPLPNTAVCVLDDTCTGVKCCMEVGFLKKSFSAFVEIDTCNHYLKFGIEKLTEHIDLFDYQWVEIDTCNGYLKFGIEKLTEDIDLFDYQWGIQEKKYLMNVIRLEYKIEDISVDQEYEIDMNMSVCFESHKSCFFTMTVFHRYRLPKVFCDWGTGFSIPEFSLLRLLEEQKETLSEQLPSAVRQILLEKLGLSDFLLDFPCIVTSNQFING
ncbi:uncharacterized protein LOC134726610 [Mytilus trossulus]|uniref:uncharacterized protein LOC134726610 n=1 Tax=Mytilus trossulus TaxID=6551 RepID=UPI0030068370